ncbi:MAG TPA: outer membrane beta-barrel protein [Chitinophaga sp.]|uniref:outer membrane beta-barrel protein n=1 Tax=Chitinophaga sp. TaxID=1869181 RepID=UPI002F94CFDC
MRKILSLVCMVTLFLFVQSQARAQEQEPFKKNLIGGSLAFFTSNAAGTDPNGGNYDGNTFAVYTTYIHYLKKNIGIGASVGYNHSTTEYQNPVSSYKITSYVFRPFIRFDIPLWQSRFSIFNDLGIGGDYSKTVNDAGTAEELKRNNWGLEAFYNPGLMFRLKSNISLQASFASLVSYSYRNRGTAGAYSHSFGITPNHSFNDLQFGINFLF